MMLHHLVDMSAIALRLLPDVEVCSLCPDTDALELASNPFAKPPAVLGRLKAVERILE